MLGIILGAFAAFMANGVIYTVFANQWLDAVGFKRDEDGKVLNPDGSPTSGSMMPFAYAIIAMFVVSGTMSYLFDRMAVDGASDGALTGFVIGALIVLPYVFMNYSFGARKRMLTVIDGGGAILGATLIGLLNGWL